MAVQARDNCLQVRMLVLRQVSLLSAGCHAAIVTDWQATGHANWLRMESQAIGK